MSAAHEITGGVDTRFAYCVEIQKVLLSIFCRKVKGYTSYSAKSRITVSTPCKTNCKFVTS